MSAIAFEETARRLAVDCEDRERKRSGVPLAIARAVVARATGIPCGTLENLRRGRSKGVRAWVCERLAAYVARQIQLEIGRLQHDLALAVALSQGVDANEISAARAAVEEAQKLIEGFGK